MNFQPFCLDEFENNIIRIIKDSVWREEVG